MGKDQLLDAAVMKWYVQRHSNGVNVHGVEIMAAAAKLVTHLNFLISKVVMVGSGSFKIVYRLFNQVLHNEEHLLSQVYNTDETGMFWQLLLGNTQVLQNEEKSTRKKMIKEKLKLAVVKKSKKPKAFK